MSKQKAKSTTRKRKARPTRRDNSVSMVTQAAAIDVRHMSTRDIQRRVDLMTGEVESLNETIGDLRSQLAYATRQRTILVAQSEGLNQVILGRA